MGCYTFLNIVLAGESSMENPHSQIPSRYASMPVLSLAIDGVERWM